MFGSGLKVGLSVANRAKVTGQRKSRSALDVVISADLFLPRAVPKVSKSQQDSHVGSQGVLL